MVEQATAAPKVSVLVTTYNHGQYVRAAIGSVLAQKTAFATEVIICDDASTDGTRKIVEALATTYLGQVRSLCRDINGGDKGHTNFLAGLEMCRGEYIATLDGDDYWTGSGKVAETGGPSR